MCFLDFEAPELSENLAAVWVRAAGPIHLISGHNKKIRARWVKMLTQFIIAADRHPPPQRPLAGCQTRRIRSPLHEGTKPLELKHRSERRIEPFVL